MNIKLTVQKFNPETDKEPHLKTYNISVKDTDRIIDVLENIKRTEDRELAFRRSCSHGICGSDAIIIKGTLAPFITEREALACKVLIKKIVEKDGDEVVIKPLRHLPIQRDLIVDQSMLYDSFKKVHPYLLENEEVKPYKEKREKLQSEKEFAKIDDATKCIMCGSCISACPVLDKNPNFIGPTALVAASRYVNDSRDLGIYPRINILDRAQDGVWACESLGNCTKVCPREIKITALIFGLKKEVERVRAEQGLVAQGSSKPVKKA